MSKDKGSYRGFFDSTTNTLYVSANNKNYTAEQIARHEAAHKKIANGEIDVDEVRKRIAANYDVDEIAAKYAEAYKGSGMTVEEAFEEIICDAEAGMNVFEEAGKTEEEVRQYGEMLAETKQAAEESEPRAPPTESGKILFSKEIQSVAKATPATREESLLIDATDDRNVSRLIREVNSVLDGEMPSGEIVLIGKPSKILSKYLKSENPLYIPQKSVKKTALTKEDGGKHGLGVGVLYELPYQFADPMAITGNTTAHKEANDKSIVVWTDWATDVGDSIIVPIRIDVNGAIGVYNNVNSEFDVTNKKYEAGLLNEENILYTRENKNIQELSAQRRQVPKVKVSDVSNPIISEDSEIVNRENQETVKASREITPEEDAEYLELAKEPEKNYDKLAKMVEKAARKAGYGVKGYHGTDQEFNKFENIKSPPGYWFSEEKKYADQHGEITKEVFLDLKRNLDFDKENDKMLSLAADCFNCKIADITESQILSFRFRDYLTENGYESIEWKNGKNQIYVVFNSEQIKSADPVTYDDNGNIIPLSERFNENNNDIRYSREIENNSEKITVSDVQQLREITNAHNGERVSVNDLTSEEIRKLEPWARKFWGELEEKSPFFRKWFGDWRAYDKTALALPIKEKEETYKAGKTKNKDSNRIISWGDTLYGETENHLVKEKMSLPSLNNIKEIVEKSVLLDTIISNKDSKNKMDNTAFMNSFYTIYNGELLKLYVEEALSNNEKTVFTRAYELKDIQKIADIPDGVLAKNGGLTDEISAKYSISDLYALVKTYDKDFHAGRSVNPLLLNENGMPKKFYHGAKKNGGFTVFRDWQYFTPNRQYAERYAERENEKALYEVYLTADKVFDTRDEDARKVFDKIRSEYGLGEIQDTGLPDWTDGYSITEYLSEHSELGYDAVILDEGGDLVGGNPVSRGFSVVVKDSSQIKSATDNIGTFDGSNSDIRFSQEIDTSEIDNADEDGYPI